MQVDATSHHHRRRLWRSRWAALGAAVAVTLGGGGLFAVNAASPESSVVMLEPVRILDTRDPVNVGLAGPFVSPTPQDLRVTGSVPTTTGTKTVVPTGATGVLLNVTPVGSTAAGFISVRPADAVGLPSTSNVNFTTGAIDPNAVMVELPVGGADDGTIEITFDAFGVAGPTSDVLVDVVGFTSEARLADLDARLADLEASVFTGQLAIRYLSNSDFVIGGASFPRPLAPDTPRFVVDYRSPEAPTSVNCPGQGRAATPGIVCVYGYQVANVSAVRRSGAGGAAAGSTWLYGFSVDVFPTDGALDGYLLANWAYRPPTGAALTVVDPPAPTGGTNE